VPKLRLGYWAAQEQFDPETLLKRAMRAEVAGFDIVVVSDHFHPWRDKGGHAGFPWILASLIAEKSKRLEVGTAVTTPLFRYHPAIVAQAFATMGYLFPRRVFLTVGTGHAMNEVPLGFSWPGYREKVERLAEALRIIRLLWEDDFVTFEGKYYRLLNAKLYTKPKAPVKLYVATSDRRVAQLAGLYADGMLTNPRGLEKDVRELFEAMERAAANAGRDPKALTRCLEFKVSYDVDYDRALQSALYWATSAVPRQKREKVSDPRELEKLVTEQEIRKIEKTWLICTDADAIVKSLAELMKLGFERIYIHSSSPDEDKFLSLLGRDLLPWMREYYEELRRPLKVSVE